MTITVCAFLVIFQTALAILTYFYFRQEIKQTISHQQFTMISLVAGNIDQRLTSSLSVINRSVAACHPGNHAGF